MTLDTFDIDRRELIQYKHQKTAQLNKTAQTTLLPPWDKGDKDFRFNSKLKLKPKQTFQQKLQKETNEWLKGVLN